MQKYKARNASKNFRRLATVHLGTMGPIHDTAISSSTLNFLGFSIGPGLLNSPYAVVIGWKSDEYSGRSANVIKPGKSTLQHSWVIFALWAGAESCRNVRSCCRTTARPREVSWLRKWRSDTLFAWFSSLGPQKVRVRILAVFDDSRRVGNFYGPYPIGDGLLRHIQQTNNITLTLSLTKKLRYSSMFVW